MEIDKNLVGKRFIAKSKGYAAELVELKLLEVSPSGDYFKIEYISRNHKWVSREDFDKSYSIIEVLVDRKKVVEEIKLRQGARRTSGKIL